MTSSFRANQCPIRRVLPEAPEDPPGQRAVLSDAGLSYVAAALAVVGGVILVQDRRDEPVKDWLVNLEDYLAERLDE